jgi:hypothetical protein
MSANAVELKLPPQQYQQLADLARLQRRPITEVAETAVAEGLANQERLERARVLMSELGRGLGASSAEHDVAREHDAYLYDRINSGML